MLMPNNLTTFSLSLPHKMDNKNIGLKNCTMEDALFIDHIHSQCVFLCSGNLGQSVASCADIMLKAIGEFACKKKPQHHLRLIRLVIFQREMLTDFQKGLKEEVGHSYKQSKGILQRGYGE